VHDGEAYRALQAERLRLEQQRLQLEAEIERQRSLQLEREQQEQQHRSQEDADRVQPIPNTRSVPEPIPSHSAPAPPPVSSSQVHSLIEPQYETPQIPAAYSHVSGAFISPRDQIQQPLYSAPQEPAVHPIQNDSQYSDPRMPSISPQVSAQSRIPPNNRTQSDASTISVVSPISTPAQDISNAASPPAQRSQKPKMSSISEVHQGTPERSWRMNYPEGATEQEIVRARQRQFMQQQFTAQQQQQQHSERSAGSPSPRASSHGHSPGLPSASTVVPQQQGGGFKELLPRGSPQPYIQSHALQPPQPVEQVRSASTQSPLSLCPYILSKLDTRPPTLCLCRQILPTVGAL
jgi:hypothetical protein